jgi:hydroxybutyrate-dimer hydrolase
MTDDPERQLFRPQHAGLPAHSVLVPHAHSQAHPEAHWGECVRQAGRFAWVALDALFADRRPSTHARRRSLAVGLSNGGAAVLRALERPHGLDGAVALAPNVLPRRGGRAFLDYAAEAALWLPLAMQRPAVADRLAEVQGFAPRPLAEYAQASQRALHALGWRRLSADRAWHWLRRRGWPAQSLGSALLSTSFDFWASAAHTYSAALARAMPAQPPLGSQFAVLDPQGQPRAASAQEAALWWSDGAGIVPGVGVGIVEARPRQETLSQLHRLLRGPARDHRIAAGIAATRCGPPLGPLPITLIHGQRDGLIPPAFSSLPWARMARAAGADLDVWLPANAPHFDAFLALPGYNRGLQPLLPHAFEALDRLTARLDQAR